MCHSMCGTIKIPPCSIPKVSRIDLNFAALYLRWWRLHMWKKFANWTRNSRQPKQSLVYRGQSSDKHVRKWWNIKFYHTCVLISHPQCMSTLICKRFSYWFSDVSCPIREYFTHKESLCIRNRAATEKLIFTLINCSVRRALCLVSDLLRHIASVLCPRPRGCLITLLWHKANGT